MLGTLGENSSLSPDEKETVLRAAVEAAEGRVPVIAGVAEYTTELAIAQAAAPSAPAAPGIMALPCMVYEQDEREAVHHFRTLAAGTGLPIMIYNNPLAYKVDLKPEGFLGLVESENIVAIKESSHDSRRMTDSWNVLGDRFLMFCGVDDLMFENVLCGAVGWVSGLVNSFPAEGVRLFELTQRGPDRGGAGALSLVHADAAPRCAQEAGPVHQARQPADRHGRPSGCAPPRLPLVGEERARVEAIVRRAMEHRPTLG